MEPEHCSHLWFQTFHQLYSSVPRDLLPFNDKSTAEIQHWCWVIGPDSLSVRCWMGLRSGLVKLLKSKMGQTCLFECVPGRGTVLLHLPINKLNRFHINTQQPEFLCNIYVVYLMDFTWIIKWEYYCQSFVQLSANFRWTSPTPTPEGFRPVQHFFLPNSQETK